MMRLEDQKEMAYHALTNIFRVPPLVLQSTLLTGLGNPAGATKHATAVSRRQRMLLKPNIIWDRLWTTSSGWTLEKTIVISSEKALAKKRCYRACTTTECLWSKSSSIGIEKKANSACVYACVCTYVCLCRYACMCVMYVCNACTRGIHVCMLCIYVCMMCIHAMYGMYMRVHVMSVLCARYVCMYMYVHMQTTMALIHMHWCINVCINAHV